MTNKSAAFHIYHYLCVIADESYTWIQNCAAGSQSLMYFLLLNLPTLLQGKGDAMKCRSHFLSFVMVLSYSGNSCYSCVLARTVTHTVKSVTRRPINYARPQSEGQAQAKILFLTFPVHLLLLRLSLLWCPYIPRMYVLMHSGKAF